MPEKLHMDLSQISRKPHMIQMDYAFAFQQKQVIFITYSQNLYSQLKENNPVLQSISPTRPISERLSKVWRRIASFQTSLCLCIDLVSVFLDEIF